MSQLSDRSQRWYVRFLLGMLAFALVILGVSALKGNSPDLIVSDGNGYYAWVRSLVIDGDINFENDFQHLYFPDPLPPEASQRTPTGLVPNKYPIGLAILETPGFLLGHAIAHLTPFAEDGMSLPYQLAVTVSLVILVLVSFYLLYRAFRNYQISEPTALLFCVMPLVGTNLLHYLVKEPAMAHGAGVALSNILIFIASCPSSRVRSNWRSSLQPFSNECTTLVNSVSPLNPPFYDAAGYILGDFGSCSPQNWGARGAKTAVIPGLLIGLSLIVRLSNLVFLPFYLWLFRAEFRNWRRSLPLVGGIGVMLLLQQLSLLWLWGRPIAHSYQGQGFTGGISGIVAMVFGTDYGLFLYHPWYLVLVGLNGVGLWRLHRQQKPWQGIILVCFTCLWILNGLWGFSGDSFGSRAFIESLPLLSLGAAMTVEHLSDRAFRWVKLPGVILAGLLIVTNIYLWGGYLLQEYPHNSDRTLEQAYLWMIDSR
ncbi:hypothetical protein ACN4EK_03940 [Pantanalinema rosaneae CENA516]|uniref:hypothetical protein n=1 Tax=Pantanalinema rosaneae TaxID=1620701 RepID=UPI003D6F8D65